MSDYPEHDKQALVVEQTQAIGEFLDWLGSQGVHLMLWREDLTDTRPTDAMCTIRRHGADLACKPVFASKVGDADYYNTHCLHWHGQAEADSASQRGICCWCGRGKFHEVTGLKSWVSDGRGTMQLLADWAGIDLAKIEAEKRRMLAACRVMNGQA